MWFVALQGYKPGTERCSGFVQRSQFNCPYRFRCKCYVALSVKEYRDRFVLLQAGDHTMSSHKESSGILNPKQRGAVERAARSAPLALGSQIHTSMQNFRPGRHIPYDRRSRKAVDRLVRKTRRDVMSSRVGGIDLDGTEGAMNQLAESLSLVKLLERHNDPNDPFHMDEHQPVCVGHQFKDGITFYCLTTCHLMNNMARAVNSGGADARSYGRGIQLVQEGFRSHRFWHEQHGTSLQPCIRQHY